MGRFKQLLILLGLSLISYEAMADFLLDKNADNALHTIHISETSKNVNIKASFGQLNETNSCEYTKLINIGQMASGKDYSFTNSKLKQYVGNGYACGKITVNSSHKMQESEFKLTWDGKNYVESIPSSSSLDI